MRVFSLASCDTCRKALKSLRNAGYDPEVIDIRAPGISEADKNRITRELGDACINTRSTTFRGLSELQKLQLPRELLDDHPTVMKRPIIDHDGTLSVGWSAEVQARFL